MELSLAPIAFFAYKRPEHTRLALNSLKNCRLSEHSYLRIYCDGPKSPADRPLTEEVRRIAREARWCGTVEVIERNENWGLSRSVRTGVAELCQEFGRAIVLEDDLDLHPSFLEFMNEALRRYENEPGVMEVSGYNYPVQVGCKDDAFFVCHASCWGWGTWQRAWKELDTSAQLFDELKRDERRRKKFDLDGTYDYFGMLEKQLSGKIDSWGVLWYQTLFRKNGLCLMPRETLVCNRGGDGTGTHLANDSHLDVMGNAEVRRFPAVLEDHRAMGRIIDYVRTRQRLSFIPYSIRTRIRALKGACGV